MTQHWLGLLLASFLLAAQPATSTYQLQSFGFGTGGTANSGTANYGLNAIAGEAGGNAGTANYSARAGETYVKEANVPTAALANNARWYNKLQIIINTNSNPTDALYAVAISKDNFSTTQYVKSDATVGSSLAFADYRTYAGWGGAGGSYITGLTSGSTYTVKVKAYRGKYSESPYGPTSSAATLNPMLAFGIDVSAIDQSTSPPYAIDLGNLLPGGVVNSPKRVWISFDTNGEFGGKAYVSGQNAGLKSAASNYTIAAQTGDLAALTEGFGLQGASATQTSGGPLNLTAPYNGAADNIGLADASIREIFNAGTPIISGRGSFILKAKTASLTPSSADYTETLTMVAAASF